VSELDWRARGECGRQGVRTERFFPDAHEATLHGAAMDDYVPADVAELCGSCSVRLRCLKFALLHGEVGIWGGVSERARIRWRRKAGHSLQPALAHLEQERQAAMTT
jgi:hypothetical protein